MCTGREYLELVSLFVQAKPPKAQEMRPCNQHELLMQLLCRRRELTKKQLADLLWNVTNGPKKKNSPRRRLCGGMDGQQSEPTDIEVVFGCREKTPSSSIAHRGWGRSRIEWLRKLEAQQMQYYQAWQETTKVQAGTTPGGKKDKECKVPGKMGKEGKERGRSRNRRKLPGCWALLPFSCGWDLAHDTSCQDVPHRKQR
ncbi:uncharacterized protein LOC108026310 [Drosophila biarmipes]|uniref:uncharacterized protein LOC108026310 n=1 Tax=Drosophila biarmipes TaxID=125945 RepID=UPI0007E723B0|nr:uncharacterized protein LOC108026310 [Drosophila biarmipes]